MSNQNDIHIKLQHRVGSGTLQVALPQEEGHVDEDEDSPGGDEDPPSGDKDPPGGGAD